MRMCPPSSPPSPVASLTAPQAAPEPSSPSPALKRRVLLRGPGAMLLSALLFALMGALVKSAARDHVPAAETTFLRFAVGLATCVLLDRAGIIRLEFHRKGLLVVRGLFGGVSALLFFLAVAHTTLARATLLSNTFVIFSALFSALFLRERLRPGGMVALAVAVAGVAVVTGTRFSEVNPGDAVALLGGLLGGIAVTSIRELRKTESFYAIFASFWRSVCWRAACWRAAPGFYRAAKCSWRWPPWLFWRRWASS